MSGSQPEETVAPTEPERQETEAEARTASGLVVLGSDEAPVCTDGVCAL
ncbi:hypothetical protein [Streptomyces macrosporus]|uniref:Uncharacterized protein n=1 Tax=Streptomyces macrosporus TaxID=44032 RepID=A0ABN3JTS3_9ACTN